MIVIPLVNDHIAFRSNEDGRFAVWCLAEEIENWFKENHFDIPVATFDSTVGDGSFVIKVENEEVAIAFKLRWF